MNRGFVFKLILDRCLFYITGCRNYEADFPDLLQNFKASSGFCIVKCCTGRTCKVRNIDFYRPSSRGIICLVVSVRLHLLCACLRSAV